jgi:FtsP/CotA-like multicopper oxidase with cupredoxin domain
MLRHTNARRAVLALIVLAVALLWAADQGLRAAPSGRAERSATTAASAGTPAGGGAAKAAATTSSTAAKPAATATTAAAPQKNAKATANGQGKRRGTTQAQRKAARGRQAPQTKGVLHRFAGVNPATAPFSPLAPVSPALLAGTAAGAAVGGPSALATYVMAGPLALPDYFGNPNWSNSPLPQLDASGAVIPGTGMRKFKDALPDLKAVLAVPDTTTFPGSDYYEISLVEYHQQMHADLPLAGTQLRGYVQTNVAAPLAPSYLGPVILAQKGRPVRVKFTNTLAPGSGGDLFIPTDTTYMGAGNGPDGTPYTQNRATLHLHGGNTPWISDGTPHQWTAPVGEADTTLLKGASVGYVPDMWFDALGAVIPSCAGLTACGVVGASNNPGPGMLTFYWTNQQSGRLMFYHDHAYGITRLNVYAGEAAGYLLYDPTEELGLLNATVPGTLAVNGTQTAADTAHLIPLVIQDKTFVPDSGLPGGQLAATDPTWNVPRYGGFGNLWFPHVYMPNQNPADLSGANPFGRWDYGPWFFPPQNPATFVPSGQPYVCTSAAYPISPAFPTGQGIAFPPLVCPGTPNPSGTPEAFMDTPVVNGKAYPTLTVDPAAYRFKILSAGNDRTLNLGLYVADPLAVGVTYGGAGYLALPAVTISGGSGTFTSATATVVGGAVTGVVLTGAAGYLATDVITVGIAPPACFTGTATPTCAQATAIASVNTEVRMVPATAPTFASPLQRCAAGLNPDTGITGLGLATVTSLGTNGTGLPGNCWPSTWPTDGRDGGVPDPATAGPAIVQLGTEGGLLPAPVVIPSTPIGYEYNRRSITVLNIGPHGLTLGPAERADVVVDFSLFAGKTLLLYNDAPAPVPAFDSRSDYYTGDPDQTSTGGAPTTMPGYGPNTRTVMQIVVNASPTTAPNVTPFVLGTLQTQQPTIYAGTLPASPNQPGPLVPETTYPAPYTATANAYSRIQDTSMTFTPLGGGAPTTINMKPKAIQELFTLDYGRMNATLGVELPLVNFTIQTTIPYGYIDPPTEIFKNGETQLWKITHNGVDTHFMHFHLFNVQVINRVGWDGAVKPPDPNEIGWKDTVRMNPLEDIVVALQPFQQSLPWPLANSVRPLDVTLPAQVPPATGTQFTGIDPTNQPALVGNDLTNFGFEYVWHCHILGHEENDMMRAMILAIAPDVPVMSSAIAAGPHQVNLAWTETSFNQTSFTVQRATDSLFTAGLTSFAVNGTLAVPPILPATTFSDATALDGTTYFYRVLGSNLVGYTRTYAAPAVGYPSVSADSLPSAGLSVTTPLSAPTNLVAVAGGPHTANLTWTNNSATATGFIIQRSVGAGSTAFLTIATTVTPLASYSDTTAPDGSTVNYQVIAYLGAAQSAPSNIATVVLPLAAPSALVATLPAVAPGSVTLTWVNNSVTATGFTVQRSTNATFTAGLITANLGVVTTWLNTPVNANTTYFYRVRATFGALVSAWVNLPSIRTAAPPVPTGLAATPSPGPAPAPPSVTLNWAIGVPRNMTITIQRSTSSNFPGGQTTTFTPLVVNATSFVDTTVARNVRYYFRIRAVNAFGNSAFTASVNTIPR